ncbi:MAG: HEAT repeat domain-containing protein [Deltaproteobacteria bacterium]|nr:HEAT repeat domain-containing protein [Deltaproteobacteria bacterium]
MATKDPIARITALLADPAPDKRAAAAIVLGELEIKTPAAIDELSALLDDELPRLQRLALEALGRVGAKKTLAKMLPLLASRDDEVRGAAIAAVTAFGDEVVPQLKQRAAEAGPDERRALDAILAQLGGSAAFSALLQSLESADAEQARAATRELRQYFKDADRKQRTLYLHQTQGFLRRLQKREPLPEVAVAAALRILGHLEDERATAVLLDYAEDRAAPPAVRQEALIGLRFAIGKKQELGRAIEVLVDAAFAPDRQLAQTALMTLGGMEIPAQQMPAIEKLARHSDPERARFALEQLGRQIDAHSARLLARLLGDCGAQRTEALVAILEKRPDATPELCKVLLEIEDTDRMWAIRGVLRRHLEYLTPALRKKLLDAAIDRLRAGGGRWKAPLDLVRSVDPEGTSRRLRELAAALKKGNKPEQALHVLRALCRDGSGDDDDRLALAVLELGQSRLDTKPGARSDDESIRLFNQLAIKGFDVAGRLRKERSVTLEQLYYLGFHFVESESPLGEELLDAVVKKAGRKKIGVMAKNKLKIAGLLD